MGAARNHPMSTSTLSRILAAAAVVLVPGACNRANCEALRDELYDHKVEWQRCETTVDCIKVPGNPGDCSGIFSCDLAVNRNHRLTVERRIASLPEESVDCLQCQSPNCVTGDLAICEPITKQCIIISEILDGSGGENGSEL
jgi:hypothetical protein